MNRKHFCARIGSIASGASDSATIKVTAQTVVGVHLAARDGSGVPIDLRNLRIAIRDVESRILPQSGTAVSADLVVASGREESIQSMIGPLAGGGDVEVTVYADVAVASCDVTLIGEG